MKLAITAMAILLASTLPAFAKDCWLATNIRGQSAFSTENYKFTSNGLSNEVLICFNDNDGTVSGTGTQFVKFGNSTLVGYGGNDAGNELVEVYQIDRKRHKMLYSKALIGADTVVPNFPDSINAFVGDATAVVN